MRYLSVCSGIEAATVAWHPLGWEPVAFSEIEPFPSAVLAHHYPDVPNLGDMTKYKEWNIERGTVDLIVGGTPCQSFSVAGLRKGMDDPRGNLALVFLGLVDAVRPTWICWENVPGVLSSGEGRDFGAFLGALGQLGYGWAYRILDAQHFGVPQRRRRVFVVGHLGDWRAAAAVLFERESLSGHPAPRREAREVSTADAGSGVAVGGGEVAPTLSRRYSYDRGDGAEPLVTCYENHGNDSRITEAGDVRTHITARAGTGGNNLPLVAAPLVARQGKGGFCDPVNDNVIAVRTDNSQANGIGVLDDGTCHTLGGAQDAVAYGIDEECNGGGQGGTRQAVAFHVTQDPISGDVSPALSSGNKQGCGSVGVAFTCSEQANSYAWERDVAPTLDAQIPNDTSNIQKGIRQGMTVRRLTPRECERLQGFEDDYTAIPWRGKAAADCPDGPRYKALGNSMAVPVMRWIGERIAMVEEVTG